MLLLPWGVSDTSVDYLVTILNGVEEYMSSTSESDVVSIMTLGFLEEQGFTQIRVELSKILN